MPGNASIQHGVQPPRNRKLPRFHAPEIFSALNQNPIFFSGKNFRSLLLIIR
jgi:hypothetical protein